MLYQTSNDNCGACGKVCAPDAACNQGLCVKGNDAGFVSTILWCWFFYMICYVIKPW